MISDKEDKDKDKDNGAAFKRERELIVRPVQYLSDLRYLRL